jgi:hypothetical protein
MKIRITGNQGAALLSTLVSGTGTFGSLAPSGPTVLFVMRTDPELQTTAVRKFMICGVIGSFTSGSVLPPGITSGLLMNNIVFEVTDNDMGTLPGGIISNFQVNDIED